MEREDSRETRKRAREGGKRKYEGEREAVSRVDFCRTSVGDSTGTGRAKVLSKEDACSMKGVGVKGR